MNFHTKENHLVRWGSPALAKQLRNATSVVELDISAMSPNAQQEAKHATNVENKITLQANARQNFHQTHSGNRRNKS